MSSDKNILGAPLLRWEDQRLLTGRGRFTDDHNVQGQAFTKFVRSPHGFAKIVACNIEAARKVKGGTTGAPAAVINAILDVLAPRGITSIDMPATPYKIWQTIQKAKPETC